MRLAAALIDARRAVGAALKQGDEAALATARAAMNDAKIALRVRIRRGPRNCLARARPMGCMMTLGSAQAAC
jgi:hypothetical protein